MVDACADGGSDRGLVPTQAEPATMANAVNDLVRTGIEITAAL
jgi:hypothetical protein